MNLIMSSQCIHIGWRWGMCQHSYLDGERHGAVNVRLSITELAKWMTCWHLTKARKIREIERLRLIGCQYINCAYTMDSKEEHSSPQIGMESEKMKNWQNYIIFIYILIQFYRYICFYFSICIFLELPSIVCIYLCLYLSSSFLCLAVLVWPMLIFGPIDDK